MEQYKMRRGGDWMFWIEKGPEPEKDYYVAFRGTLVVEHSGEYSLHVHGASWYGLWLDGHYLLEGPARHNPEHPEYQLEPMHLEKGKHIIAVKVHEIGVRTERHPYIEPFLFCRLLSDDQEIEIHWRCHLLGGYHSERQRISGQHGWIEWCDTRHIPQGWRELEFDDSGWASPVSVEREIGPLMPLSSGPVRLFRHALKPMREGPLAHAYGMVNEDPSARFFLRDLECRSVPQQGIWRRYDLGRVRLGKPRFVLDLPEGAEVEFCTSEYLIHGRVSPYISLAGGTQCQVDHYVSRGGRQEFFPLWPKGGRFLEVHILAAPDQVSFLEEEYIERCYFEETSDGAFSTDDEELNRIWSIGVETLRACAEDAVTDCPTRERGQWVGDALSVGMEIGASAYRDLRLFRRSIVQSAHCARQDGLIPGLTPGTVMYLCTYSLQWVTSVVRYHELTGERELLEEMFPYAERNFEAFEPHISDAGLKAQVGDPGSPLGWIFVDWGYFPNEGPSDMSLNLHFIEGTRSMQRWCFLLGHEEKAAHYRQMEQRITLAVQNWLNAVLSRDGWEKVGYHRSCLALRAGLLDGALEEQGMEYIKQHILACFPNREEAPRCWSPMVSDPMILTPYFSHFAFPPLIERGDMDFILDQFRTCWGWAMSGDRTTWLEVFDTRWSHSHHWSGCPTWQLSRYALGLQTRFDLGMDHYVFNFHPGSLPRARGRIVGGMAGSSISVDWKRDSGKIHYRLECPGKITLHLPDSVSGGTEQPLQIEDRWEELLPECF